QDIRKIQDILPEARSSFSVYVHLPHAARARFEAPQCVCANSTNIEGQPNSTIKSSNNPSVRWANGFRFSSNTHRLGRVSYPCSATCFHSPWDFALPPAACPLPRPRHAIRWFSAIATTCSAEANG